MSARAASPGTRGELPSRAQGAIAAFCGIVFGALGGGLLAGTALACLILITAGVWRACTHLAAIAVLLGARPDADQTQKVRNR